MVTKMRCAKEDKRRESFKCHCLQTKNKHPFSSIDNDEKIGVNK